MHEWLVKRLGLRLKRSIGFGLMIATGVALFWYVMQSATGVDAPFAGSVLFWLIMLPVASAIAYATIYKRRPR